MSRSVKDLRELICVSRLTVRESDEENDSIYNSDTEEQIVRAFSRLSGPDHNVQFYRPESVMYTRAVYKNYSPDSGIGTNGQSPEIDNGTIEAPELSTTPVPHPPQGKSKRSGASRRKKRKEKILDTFPTMHELPKPSPLPPVACSPFSNTLRPDNASSSEEDEFSEPYNRNDAHSISSSAAGSSREDSGKLRSEKDKTLAKTNFDNIMTFLDVTLVNEWLATANEQVSEIRDWIHMGDNYVQFAHFWLSEFPHMQRQEIFHLEHSIILDHLNLAFASGRSSGAVLHKHIVQFLEAVFKEYPGTILSSKGPHLFLNYLDTLTSEKHSQYKVLLSDVRCSTQTKQYAQLILAVRAFALVSSWSSIINFYRRLATDSRQSLSSCVNTIGKKDPNMDRIYHAIRVGYVDVVHYLLASGKVSARSRDAQGRTLIFTAVMHNQPDILNFLLKKVKPSPDINMAADNGNTPLHAAANSGDVLLVTTLLRARDIEVNAQNLQCEGTTPLHLAVLHGHTHIVEVLLVAGADTKIKMGDLSVLDMAKDFGHDEIYKVLKSGKVEV